MGGFENPAGNNQRLALSAVFLADSCYSLGAVICSFKPSKILTFELHRAILTVMAYTASLHPNALLIVCTLEVKKGLESPWLYKVWKKVMALAAIVKE